MSKINRREFLVLGALGLPFLYNQRGDAQTWPYELTLIRDRNLATTLSLNDCVTGVLSYVVPPMPKAPNNPAAGYYPEIRADICSTLELPFRNEKSEISCIRPGVYSGHVREDGPLGWRIQLEGTKQLAIQIHPGNVVEDTHGCILVGTRVPGNACSLSSSKPARDQIRSLYGNNNSRAFKLTVK
jgi:hypothetical protein